MTITKLFNNSSIEIREDGYFNATAMCKAFGKKAQDYLRLDTTKAFLEALRAITGFTDVTLVEIHNGGKTPGTWVERRVAIDLARWLSPEFHVQVILWTEEILSGQRPHLPEITSEDDYIRQMIDLFSRTSQPLQKEVILKNTASNHPPTRRLDMKVHGKNIYYEVKMHTITMSDLKEIFFNRKYPDLLFNLHSNNYRLYFLSPQGINEEANYFLSLMKNAYFIHGEDLALEAANMLMEDSVARTQTIKHILPLYSYLLPPNWRNTLDLPALPSSPKLLYRGELPLGVAYEPKKKESSNTYRARFRHLGKSYSLGCYTTPEEAGLAVKQEMLKVKGKYSY
jgi:KilA-N domain